MSTTKRFSEVQLGGDRRDNPNPLELANYKLSPDEMKFFYQLIDVIASDPPALLDQQVSGLARLDNNRMPIIGPNDLVYLPCPKFCNRNDVNPSS